MAGVVPARLGALAFVVEKTEPAGMTPGAPHGDAGTSEDGLLDGRVRLRQSRDGYRAAIDPVLLAAAVDVKRGGLVLDAGLGAGAAALCLLARRPDVRVIGIESEAETCALAIANAAANAVAGRLEVREGRLSAVRRALAAEGVTVDAAMTNPPYLSPASADPSPEAGRRRANVESAGLADWIGDCGGMLRAKGALTLVHRADRLDDAILALRSAGMGEIAVLPLWPKPGQPARRVLLRARKGIAGAARLLPGLTLHRPEGEFTDEAEAVLRHAAAVDWKGSTSPANSPM